MIDEQLRRRDLLGARRPRSNVSDDVVHRSNDVRRRDRPTHAKSRRRERLRDRVHDDDVRCNRRAERDRIDVRRATGRDHPIHLIVHHEQRTLGCVRVSRSPRARGRRSSASCSAVEHSARRIERRVQREQPRAANVRAKQLRRRKKSGRRIAFDHDRQRAEHLAVVVVVPRRHAEDDAFARIDHGAIERVDRRARARRDENRLAPENRDRGGADRNLEQPSAGVSSPFGGGYVDSPARSASTIPSSSSRGIRNCFELKSPTVKLRICRPSATSARTSPAILRIAELRRPSAR